MWCSCIFFLVESVDSFGFVSYWKIRCIISPINVYIDHIYIYIYMTSVIDDVQLQTKEVAESANNNAERYASIASAVLLVYLDKANNIPVRILLYFRPAWCVKLKLCLVDFIQSCSTNFFLAKTRLYNSSFVKNLLLKVATRKQRFLKSSRNSFNVAMT